MAVKVLVVDDNKEKLKRLIELLSEAGIERSSIDVAVTGADARTRLTQVHYDLMILDVALPMRAEDKPDRRGGIRLLEEVVERELYKLPVSVVGLTGFEDLFNEFGEQFHARLWTLERYDSGNTGWADRLKAKAKYILARASQPSNITFGTDICIISALHSPELSALRTLPWNWSSPTSLDEVGYYYRGQFTCPKKNVSVIATAAPRMGMVASALLAAKMIAKFRPRLMAMVGICAGVKGECNVGDVLVADPSWDWQMGKFTKDGFAFAPDQINAPLEVTQKCVQLGDDRQLLFNIREQFTGLRPSNVPVIKVGAVASGSSVLADLAQVSKIKLQHRKLLGIEMEIYGMYAAARDSSPPRPLTFAIKSVCDFADTKKADGFQPYAAHVSAKVFGAFAERYYADFL